MSKDTEKKQILGELESIKGLLDDEFAVVDMKDVPDLDDDIEDLHIFDELDLQENSAQNARSIPTLHEEIEDEDELAELDELISDQAIISPPAAAKSESGGDLKLKIPPVLSDFADAELEADKTESKPAAAAATKPTATVQSTADLHSEHEVDELGIEEMVAEHELSLAIDDNPTTSNTPLTESSTETADKQKSQVHGQGENPFLPKSVLEKIKHSHDELAPLVHSHNAHAQSAHTQSTRSNSSVPHFSSPETELRLEAQLIMRQLIDEFLPLIEKELRERISANKGDLLDRVVAEHMKQRRK